ncbi:hypothetical protein [Desulfogranum mediterraneum]|uniref:hypothetical protein n=1 Tax=Desulfogranum mediterraneum TaxID=160661 RepID=UPI000427AFF1|nr:hypothetical protein [Desulfogranum mediterraneum]
MYPDIGACGAELEVSFDGENKSWLVHLKKGEHELEHHLEFVDAEDCLDGKQCVALGLEVSQLLNNIKGKQF